MYQPRTENPLKTCFLRPQNGLLILQVDLTGVENWTVENVPDYAVCYLVNGDADNLSEEDIKNIDQWCDKMQEMGFKPDMFDEVEEIDGEYFRADFNKSECIEPGFTTNPAFGLPCNCYPCLFQDLRYLNK